MKSAKNVGPIPALKLNEENKRKEKGAGIRLARHPIPTI